MLQLSSLSKTVDRFPARFRYGWGQKLMGLDKLPDTLSGRGVRIAIIDSGADRSHPNLGHVSRGQDFSGSGAGGAEETGARTRSGTARTAPGSSRLPGGRVSGASRRRRRSTC
ncbi:MAG: hypothetical protein R3F14_09815 [Polyangiaceae bacterium]